MQPDENAAVPPPPRMPAHPAQMWIARGAIAVCVAMIVVWYTVGFLGGIKSVEQGTATVYYPSPSGVVLPTVLGTLAGAGGVIFWMQPGRFFRLASLALFVLAVYAFVKAPSILTHHVAVTPDSFCRRVGRWYLPVEECIDFDDVESMAISEVAPGPSRRRYELHFITKPNGDIVAVPLYDMMRAALPEIVRRAEARGIRLRASSEGWTMPPDLAH